MKRIAAVCIAGLFVCLAACKKHDDCPQPPEPDAACEVVQSSVINGDSQPQYRKEYDGAGRVTKVVAALYGLLLEDSIALQMRYNGNSVYFISEENTADTVLIAAFDAANRLVKLTAGSVSDELLGLYFEPVTDFVYSSGKLSAVIRRDDTHTFTYFTQYDQNGNIIRIFSPADDAKAGTLFTYDLSVKATAQYYSDQNGTDLFNNGVYLAEFLGWLPDLMPVNKRLSFRQVFNDEDTTDNEPGYVFNHTDLSDHVYDSDGKLLSYKIADGNITYVNVWKCSEQSDPN